MLAKGVRTDKKHIAASFEPFTRVSLVYYEKVKSDTHLLSEVQILDSQAFVRSRLDRLSYASYLTDLVDTFFGIYDPHPEVFNLLAEAFQLFKNTCPVNIVSVFEVKLLEQIGWLPVLTQCVVCGSGDLERAFFSPKQGGVLCAKCDRSEKRTVPLSAQAIRTLIAFLKEEFEEAVKVKLDLQTERELERVIRRFIEFRLEYPLRSSRFLSEIRSVLQ